jgi:hypothetical protein
MPLGEECIHVMLTLVINQASSHLLFKILNAMCVHILCLISAPPLHTQHTAASEWDWQITLRCVLKSEMSCEIQKRVALVSDCLVEFMVKLTNL